MAWADWVTISLFATELFGSEIKARFKRRTFHVPNLIIRFGTWKVRRMNQWASSTELYLGRPASRTNLHTYFSNLSTAFMIGCIVSCDTWRELTEAWWPFRSRNGGLNYWTPAQNGGLPTCINTIYIFIPYLYLNMIAISLNINGTQQKKLLRLGVYKCSNPGAKTNYWNEIEWK